MSISLIVLILVIVLVVIGILVGVKANEHRVRSSFWFLLALLTWFVVSGLPVLR